MIARSCAELLLHAQPPRATSRKGRVPTVRTTAEPGRGESQGAATAVLPEPIVVRVRTESGQPVAGREIAFLFPEGESGGVDPDTAVTTGGAA